MGEVKELKAYIKTKQKITELRVETKSLRENITDIKEMTDNELLDWISKQMTESRMFTDPSLTLKDMALRLGLTQKKLK